jgi:hypothetical protein
MTIYGENPVQFRTAAATPVLAAVSASQIVLGTVIASLLTSLADLALATAAGWPGPAALTAPAAGRAQGVLFSAPPLADFYQWSAALNGALLAALAFALIYFWPTGQSLATRLFVHHFAAVIGAIGVMAPMLDRETLRSMREVSGIAGIYWAILYTAIGTWIVVLAERRALGLLASHYSVLAPSERLRLWLARMPVGFSLAALLALLNDYAGGVFACLITMAASLLENVSRVPPRQYERLSELMMRGAAITTPIAAIVVTAASIRAFGLDAARPQFPPRAVVISMEDGIRLRPPRLVQPLAVPPPPTPAQPTASPEEKKIDARWSK